MSPKIFKLCRCRKHILVTALAAFATRTVIAQTPPPTTSTQKPFSPEPLPPGWDQVDERLVFLTVRLSSVETSLQAVEKAIKTTGYSKALRSADAAHARQGNETMDRNGGGPVPWQDFYGRTAQDFYFHPGTKLQAHAHVGNGRDANLSLDHTDAPVAIGRPPQLDYIYRANSENQKRSEDAAAELGGKIDKLLERRRALEFEQSDLWSEIAFQAVASRDFSSKPLYRFKLKSTPEGQQSDYVAGCQAACDFFRTLNQLTIDTQASVEKDPGSVFHNLSMAVSTAHEKFSSQLAETPSLAADLNDDQSKISKVNAVVKRLDDLARNMDESCRLSKEGDAANDDQRKNTFRRLLQDSVLNIAASMLTANQCVLDLAKDWKIIPDTQNPVGPTTVSRLDTPPVSTPPNSDATTHATVQPTTPADTATSTQQDSLGADARCRIYMDNGFLKAHLTSDQFQIVKGLQIGKLKLADRRNFTYFKLSADFDNESKTTTIENQISAEVRILCVDSSGQQSVFKYSKKLTIGTTGIQTIYVGDGQVHNKSLRARNNNDDIPKNVYVSFHFGQVEFCKEFLRPPSDDHWWLNDDLINPEK